MSARAAGQFHITYNASGRAPVAEPAGEILIRPLTADGLDGALRLSTLVGWNQQLDDWRMLLRLAPAGTFAALADDRIVGTAIGIDYGDFAWIAMMLVDPAYRRCGLGSRLLDAALAAVPERLPVRLDATPAGRPLYQQYGFEDEAALTRLVRDGSAGREAGVAPGPDGAGPLTPVDMKAVAATDRTVFGGERTPVLEWELDRAPQYARLVRGGDPHPQYCFGRQGRLFDQIGPVVAGTPDTALALVGAALAAAGRKDVVVDAFDDHASFTAELQRLGFVPQRPLYRMCRRSARQGGTSGPARRPLTEYAILGPEFA